MLRQLCALKSYTWLPEDREPQRAMEKLSLAEHEERFKQTKRVVLLLRRAAPEWRTIQQITAELGLDIGLLPRILGPMLAKSEIEEDKKKDAVRWKASNQRGS